ncbi:MAG: DUF6106 family protein [Defluviitaleaceae bacterium]|nr:DUF6106 family protein [Defluviitaleaceae bacterium]
MNDVFKEQIVKRQPTATDALKRVGLIIAALLVSIIALMFGNFFGPFIVAGVVFGAWFLLSLIKREYEYSFTAGELDIDVIYNRSRRKRKLSIRVNDIEIMAHIDDKAHSGAFQGTQITKDYSSGVSGPDTYIFMINHENKRTKVIIEPNEVMLKAIAGVLTRRRLHVKL